MNHLLRELAEADNELLERENAGTDPGAGRPRTKHILSETTVTSRHHSTPVWPSELPDVFSFPDAFFDLQKDLDYSVLEYLVRMGYAEAAESFSRELGFTKAKGDKDATGGEAAKKGDEVKRAKFVDKDVVMMKKKNKATAKSFGKMGHPVTAEDVSDVLKRRQARTGIDSVRHRKAVMRLVLAGDVEGALALVDTLWPAFFERRPLVRLRLLHLQAVEMLRAFFAQPEPSDAQQKAFFDRFVAFVNTHLADPALLSSNALTAAMEATMGVLVRGRFADAPAETQAENPTDGRALADDVAAVLDPALRRELAHEINAAVRAYTGGDGDGTDCDYLTLEDGKAALAHDQGRLVRLVQLFAASYAGKEGKLEATAAISIK